MSLVSLVVAGPGVLIIVLKVAGQANWAGNLRYSTGNVLYPTSVEQVQEIVRKCDKLTALGTRHSFNAIADSEHNLLAMQALNRVVSLDRSANTVTVEGGMKYGELAPYLYRN